MKNTKFINIIIISSLILFLFTFKCSEYDKPPLITDHTIDYMETPVITSVDPPDSAIAGVRRITITGQNFVISGGDSFTKVYIGGEATKIRTITENEIVIERPKAYGDEMPISVMIPKALGVAHADYKIEIPVEKFGDFAYEAYPLTDIEVDNNENIFIATRRKILKLTPDGIELTEIGYYGSDFGDITDMKFGIDGYLYVLVGEKEIYRIDVTTGNEEEYVSISRKTDVFDFDASGNIYTGRRDGIFVINLQKEITETGHYDDIPLIELRVFGNFLYSASASTLYRNQILDNNGTLGEDQTVVDLGLYDEFNSFDISSFNFDINGTIYFCLKNSPNYSIFVYEDDGSIVPYYKNNILPKRVDQIIWGSDRYVYLNRGSLPRDSVRVYRMGMDKPGAPYLGRNF
jgi:hypothetical protein